MQFVLIRHTACELASDVCYGQLDVALRASARADIALTLGKVPSVDAVFSSPAIRCSTLARQLAERDRCPLMYLDELRELSFGAWEGQRWDAIPREQSDHWACDPWHRAPPGGESEAALLARVAEAHREIAKHGAPHVAIVAHGGPLRLLRCLILDEPLERRWTWSIAPGDVARLASPVRSTQ